jgi:phosphonate transport system substrate-binding protein
MTARDHGRLAFGIAAPAVSRATAEHPRAFVAELGRRAGIEVELATPQSYDALVAMFAQGQVDIGWLPPIPFVGLERAKLAIPLVSHHRGSVSGFDAVLVALHDPSLVTLYGLVGKRAAWVDPLSASGYVLPRIQLMALGIDPRTTFGSERFYLSHEASVRAVLARQADVAATYARHDEDGKLVRGSWSRIEGADAALRVIASFGAVPPDVVAARMDVPEDLRERLAKALMAMSSDDASAFIVRDLFGVDDFRPWTESGHESLRRAMADAAARGLLDAGDLTGQFPTHQ